MSTSTLSAILSVGILTISVPILVLIVWCVKMKAKVLPALTGAIIFLIFACILEMFPHIFFLYMDNPVSRIITATPILYALYAGLVAGLFEETGRFVAFRFLQKKTSGKETAITYGIGHGGFESMSVVGFGFIQYFSIALMIHNGSINSLLSSTTGDELTSLQSIVSLISSMTVGTCALTVLERAYAFIFHIALSVIVYYAVQKPEKKWLFPVAILLHTGLDIFAGLYQMDVLPLIATEAIGIIYTGLVTLWAHHIYTTDGDTNLFQKKG